MSFPCLFGCWCAVSLQLEIVSQMAAIARCENNDWKLQLNDYRGSEEHTHSGMGRIDGRKLEARVLRVKTPHSGENRVFGMHKSAILRSW